MHILLSYVYVLACTVLILNFVTVQCINSNGSVTWTILSNISKIFSKKTGACAHRYFPRKETTGKIFCASTNEATNAWLSNQIHKKPKHLTPDCKYITGLNNKHRTQSKLFRTFSQILELKLHFPYHKCTKTRIPVSSFSNIASVVSRQNI